MSSKLEEMKSKLDKVLSLFTEMKAVKKRAHQLEENSKKLEEAQSFNCPLNPFLDRKRGSLAPRKSIVTGIDCFQEELDLIDIWPVQNPDYLWFYLEPKGLSLLLNKKVRLPNIPRKLQSEFNFNFNHQVAFELDFKYFQYKVLIFYTLH